MLLELLRNFQTEHLGALERPADVVWDAYVDAQQKVHLLDVAPFHESTDPILFTWPELRARRTARRDGKRAAQAVAADDLLRLVPADAAGGVGLRRGCTAGGRSTCCGRAARTSAR